MVDCISEVPDAARHKPAYFKELSGFFSSRDDKLVLPSRALTRRQLLGKCSGHEQSGCKMSPTIVGKDYEHASNRKVGMEKGLTGESSHQLDAAVAKEGPPRIDGKVEGDVFLPCKSCMECPCRIRPTKGLRKRLFRYPK